MELYDSHYYPSGIASWRSLPRYTIGQGGSRSVGSDFATIPLQSLCSDLCFRNPRSQKHRLDFLGLGIDQLPPQLLEEILTRYPRLNFKSAIRDLLVEHCRRNPAAQILAWTDEIARTAGCTLNGQPIPTASQLMLAAPFAE
jgi:hypothetical protein